jgi:RHS repeat-associated protein
MTKRLFALMALACFVVLSSSSLFAQNVQHTENKPDLGLRSDARVDPSTLGMSFSIPLASYPGRAGHTLPVGITYSSKSLRLDYRGVDSLPASGTITWTAVEFAEHSTAGWTSTLTPPRVEFTGMGQFYDWQGRATCQDVCLPGQTTAGDHYVKRIHVHMPDGSSHELRLDDQVYVGLPVAPFTGTFHAVDGSRMRFDSNAGAASVLYLPDGSRFLFGAYNNGSELSATHFIDRHGNTLTYNPSTRQWTDTLGRLITNPLPANPVANTDTYFMAKQVGGNEVTYTLRWKSLADVLTPDPATGVPPPMRYPGNYKCAHNSYQNVSPSLITSSFDTRVCVELDQSGNPLLFNPVVLAEIVLPTGKFYRFTYNVYGEIDKIFLTTGATDKFSYGEIPTLSLSKAPYNHINRGVLERRVSKTGASADESVWTYAVTSTPSSYTVRATRPDLSYSERLIHRSRYTQSGGPVMQFDFDDPRMGMVYEERSFDRDGLMLRRQLSECVEAGPTFGGHSTAARDPKVIKQVSIILDGPGSNALWTATVNRYEQENQPLNLTSTTVYSFDDTTSKATAQTASVNFFNPPDSKAVRTTATAYLDDAAYFARGLVALPTSVTVTSGMPGGVQRARTEISYDQQDVDHALLTCGATVGWSDPGTTVRGNATTTGSWLNTTGTWLQTHARYDQCGNVRKNWDDTTLNNPAQIEYSDVYHFAYATLTTSPDPDGGGPLSAHSTSTQYDLATGLVTATIDANSQKTTFAYNDPLNRLKQVIRAEADALAQNKTTYEYDDTARTITVKSDLHAFEDQVLKTVSMFDGLGRATESRQYEGGNNFIAVQTEYDVMGRPFKTSNPYRPWQSQTVVWTTQLFNDGLGRVTSVTTPDNAVVSTSYSGNTVTVTDQAGKKRKSVTDALGRLIEVYEDPNGLNYQTTYLYDELDNLVKVTQGTQQRFFMYDSLKRLRRARNPEQGTLGNLALPDPITGNSAWSIGYEYDANNNLTQKTDARGVVSTYIYDYLNRNTTINYSDTTVNPDVSRVYDGAVKGKGRLWKSYAGGDELVGSNVEKTVIESYDALGRPLVQRQLFKTNNVWSTTYETSREYNRAGAVTLQTYPSQHWVRYNYDPAGRVADNGATLAFKGNLGDGVERTYAAGISYSQWGGLSQEQYGADTAVYNKLHYNIRGQLCDVRASNLNVDEWSGELGALVNYYGTNGGHCGSGTDNNGNVLRSETIINSYFMEDRYSYDAVNRLTAVNEWHNGSSNTGSQQYDYDRWGNRTIKNTSWGIGINTKQFTVDTATNRLGVPGGQAGVMNYDFAGNLTNDTYTGAGLREYDAENRMTRAWGGNNQWQSYTYNADGQRVRRKVDNQETWHIYGFDGELLAEYAANGPAASPQKEYGYRNGQLLLTAEPLKNVALASNNATASASSTWTNPPYTYPVSAVNNGDHNGLNAGYGGNWHSSTATFPQWVEVVFDGSKTINEIDVFSLQDNYPNPIEPTEATTFSLYGLTGFQVQYWNGTAWATVPGGSVSGNNKVWKKITFAPLTTTKIRVLISATSDNWSRTVEVEAWSPSINWLITDHLGTPRMVIDATGALANIKRHDYLPFGEELFGGSGGRSAGNGYSSGDAVRQKFTSKERDTETGLDYFGARYYAASQGRFSSTDPLHASARPHLPQTWNRYAYALNTPLRLVDPTGMVDQDPDRRRPTTGGMIIPNPCTTESPTCRPPVITTVTTNSGPPDPITTTDVQPITELQVLTGQENPLPQKGALVSFLDAMAGGQGAPGALAAGAIAAPRAGPVGALGAGATIGAIATGALLIDIGRTIADAIPLPDPRVSTTITVFHYTTSGPELFVNGLWPASSATDHGALTAESASQGLGIPPPTLVYPVTFDPKQTLYLPGVVPPNRYGPGGLTEYYFPRGTPPGSVGIPRPVPSGKIP